MTAEGEAPDGRRQIALLCGLFVAALVLRVHDAASAPPLSGYDGIFHAANIGIILFEGRLPLPHEGWATFHPPLYYALSAGLWRFLLPDGLAAHQVLFALRLFNVLAGLATGLAVYFAARIAAPLRPRAALHATALALFLPMQLGPSFLVGNEMLGACLSAWGIALLLAARRSLHSRPLLAGLGVVLGLGAITKFNTLVVAAAAGLVMIGTGLARHGPKLRALVPALIVAVAAAATGGWYFARNVQLYGTPIVMQPEILATQMARSGYGPPRVLGQYVSLRADLLVDPTTPLPSARKAVWPATFASTWFDFSVVHPAGPLARRAAWLLFAFGAVFTALAGLGALRLWSTRSRASPSAVGVLLLVVAIALASYIGFTWRVATASALKGLYLSPALLPCCVFAGVGCDALAARGRVAALAVAALVGGFVATVFLVFWIGLLPPFPVNTAAAVLRSYSDPPVQRVFDFFVGEEAGSGEGEKP